MELTNYAGGAGLELPQDAQIVKGVSGNGFYLPYGQATQALNENCAELTLSLWRKWDGQADDEDRGIFKLKNLEAKFAKGTDKLTVSVNGVILPIDNKDDTEFNHWCFIYKKLDKFKVYKNGKNIFECPAPNVDVDFADGVIIGGGKTHATFDELRIYAEDINENEVAGLHQLVSKGTQVHHVEHLVNEQVALHSPKYLGTTKHLPELQKVIIEKGAKAGVNQASIGDWFLMIETIQNFEKGYCYRWTGKTWQKLDPPEGYTEEYQACLLHIFEVPELMQGTGHYGALFCKMLVAQRAMIDYLVARRVLVDSDTNNPDDFSVEINKDVGIKAMHKGDVTFEVSPYGKAHFKGDITTPSFELKQGNIKSYTLNYSDDFLAEIIKNSKYKGSKPIPLNGTHSCSGVWNGKEIIKLSNTFSFEETVIQNVIIGKTIKSEHLVWYDLIYGDVYVKLILFNLTLWFKDGTTKTFTDKCFFEELKSEYRGKESVSRDTYYSTSTGLGVVYPPSKKVKNLKLLWNKSKTTMKVKDLPIGDDDYEKGIVFIENGFLKIKE